MILIGIIILVTLFIFGAGWLVKSKHTEQENETIKKMTTLIDTTTTTCISKDKRAQLQTEYETLQTTIKELTGSILTSEETLTKLTTLSTDYKKKIESISNLPNCELICVDGAYTDKGCICPSGKFAVTGSSGYIFCKSPIDCVMAPNGVRISECSATCGNGTITMRKPIEMEAQYGGMACPTEEERTYTESCFAGTCPVDCILGVPQRVGPECSATCGNGTVTWRTPILSNSMYGGTACPTEEERTYTESCFAGVCPVDCILGVPQRVGPECSATCGNGKVTWRTPIEMESQYGGMACPTEEERTYTESCFAGTCPVDCVVSSTGVALSCSATCGTGVQSKIYPILIPSAGTGRPCPTEKERTYTESCFAGTCPVNCILGVPQIVGPACSATCGWGVQTKIYPILVPSAGTGRPCSTEKQRTYTSNCFAGTCPVDCVVSPTGVALSCSVPCGWGVQSNIYPIIVPSAGTGRPCPTEKERSYTGTCYRQGLCPVQCKMLNGVMTGACPAKCGTDIPRSCYTNATGSCPGDSSVVRATKINGNRVISVLMEDGTIWSFGQYNLTVEQPQVLLNDFVEFSSGDGHVLAIRNNRSLISFGQNNWGELGVSRLYGGDGYAYDISGGKRWKSVNAAPVGASYAIDENDILWSSGNNNNGRLGGGISTIPGSTGGTGAVAYYSTLQNFLPTERWVRVSGGPDYTLGIKTDGSLWGWGGNIWGQLGDGTTIGRSTLAEVVISGDRRYGWTNVVAGVEHAIGMQSDGTLWAWGRNNRGQLGDGSTVDKSVPTLISVDYDWKKVIPINGSTIALKTDGTFWGWGNKENGQLDQIVTANSSTNVLVPTIGRTSAWLDIGGYELTCVGIKKDGTVWGWGNNVSGQLSGPYDRIPISRGSIYSPVQIPLLCVR